MKARHSQSLYFLTLVTDLLMAVLAWVIAYFLRFHAGLEVPLGQPPIALYVKVVPFIWVIWLLAAVTTGFLKRTLQHSNALMEGFDLIPTAAVAVLIFISFTYFYEEYRYSRITLLFFGALLPICLLFGRYLVRTFFRWYRKKQEPRQLFVVARGYGLLQALTVLKGIDPIFQPEIILVGNDDKHHDETLVLEHGLSFIHEPEDWTKFFIEQPTHSLLISLPQAYAEFIDKHLEQISLQVPEIKILPDIARFTKLNPGIELVEGLPLISVHESPLHGTSLLSKRIMDIAGSLFALIVFSPIMAVVAMLVKWSSPGPVFYRQERMGLDGTSFQCLKFRSMPVDAEKATGAVWAKAGENRATPLGAFLRKSSLDELPQFINVLRGEMSLVGPRPERPVFVREFRTQISGYMLRHKVKTGMTGWAQVNGWRGSTSLEKRIECDLYYIQNWSLWLDVKILFMTVDEVFRGKNAY